MTKNRLGKKRSFTLVLFAMLIVPATRSATGTDYEQFLGGGPDAPIKIEVFSDFQCPSCRQFYVDTMKMVLKDYCSANKVCVIYREFPLPMHPFSREAARYSIAAQKVGHAQWLAVFDALYTDQAVWSLSGNVKASVARAVSPADYQKILKLALEPSVNEALERDVAEGTKRQVQSTPTFFVTTIGREQKVVGGLAYPVLKDFFDKIVK